MYINILISDVVATVFVYIAGMIFKNASIYDPYWSVAPLVILPLVILESGNFHIGIILLIIAISYWAIRLTMNWAYTFGNLTHQDWRYSMLKEKTKKMYPLVNLLGIHLMPTLIVYLVILPALYYVNNSDFTIFNVIGFVICFIAVTIQLLSDYQLHSFRKTNNNRKMTITTGLWKVSRHPNYFGEVLMWWGVYIFCLASDLNSWYLIVGAIANTLLFLFISIPLQENRLLSYKDNYEDYIKKTNVLIPWFSK
jgi:steroid 5-alpha reductase family enzyme